MFKRRAPDGFNLAFLDVMACGLGAIILILMLVKFNAPTTTPSDALETLQQELNALQDQQTAQQADIDAVNKKIATATTASKQIQQNLQQLKIQQDATQRAVNDKKAILAKVEKSVAAAAPRQAEDPIKLQGAGEENYLLGLKVEGRHIGILIDASASMTNEKLIDIIKSKISSDAKKKSSPKWQRTKRVAKWLLARVPQQSNVTMVSFNKTANQIGPRRVVPATSRLGMKQLAASIDQLIPHNGTNLQGALTEIKKLSPDMTHLYIVTDGLPTLGENAKTISSLARCALFFSKSKTITGECRLSLFVYTVKQANMSGVQVNVILLPLEGDPQAPQAYWEWTASTGGLMISPADSWP